MARLGHVLSIGWRLRPAPTAVGGGRSRAAAAAADSRPKQQEKAASPPSPSKPAKKEEKMAPLLDHEFWANYNAEQ